ncbi:YbgC/FadM family acyl-CoA thioesterase [Oceaniradius stylonematis]|uniref:YbgC/FadM family acyl-CoA thioesterase n=1 Tax=Oceaniradius stylonematis TaxID=2184161 RepID=A0A3A8A9Q0_9HYPH|nr:YbgC/FadM family acyl-CoA thioesterase [Oceaniradius stylonematis]RKF06068.1 YbgC/FadM family acyl-CoA thioesterase [Oceaniradius stylonematis]RNC95771.1 MAG: YbgC/FadM family acyl-CoA thioesterase [Oricola sp.]
MSENADNGKSGGTLIVPLDGAVEDGVHRFTARIYYADTDFSGAVYHARYLELLERGRSDYLRCLGVYHTELAGRDTPLFWVVRRMEIDFRAAARIDDIVIVETRLAELHKARIVMAQTILRDGAPILTASVTAALINDRGRPQRMPREWVALFGGTLS